MSGVCEHDVTPEWLRKFPCSRCGVDCYRIAYIGWSLVCVECFGKHAFPAAGVAQPDGDGT